MKAGRGYGLLCTLVSVCIAAGNPGVAPRAKATAQAASGTSLPKTVTTDREQLLTAAQQRFRLLTRLQKIAATGEETVESWELRDQNNRVVYREAYPVAFEHGSFESTVSIVAEPFTTQQGGGILIHGMDLPSAPDSGGWVRVFGYTYGRSAYGADPSLFTSFGLVQGEYLDLAVDPSKAAPAASGGATVTVMHDVLRFRLWTGNFSIVYPVLINWITGKLQPAWRCLETTSKGPVERCSYAVTVEARRDSQPTFVRLFPEPDEGFIPKHVIVQPQSRIEYLEARVPVAWSEDRSGISFLANGDTWMKVRIDGREGWIHTEEDFEAVGLPLAG
jgi:hypothetical protein